jgi:hypothetical protein
MQFFCKQILPERVMSEAGEDLNTLPALPLRQAGTDTKGTQSLFI